MSKTKHIKILILAVGKRREVKMVTWIPPYLPAQQGEKGNKKRPQFFSPLVDTLNLLSYNLLDGCFWHRIPSCLSFCIRDSELPRYIHLDFIFPDTRIPDPVLKVLPASDAEFFSKKLLTDLDFFFFFSFNISVWSFVASVWRNSNTTVVPGSTPRDHIQWDSSRF